MADQSLVLYSFWRSTAAYRVRVAAKLKSLDITERFVDLDAGEQHDDDFRRINPMGAVPALVVDDARPLTESLAIIEYLDAITPEQVPLVPDDALGATRVRAISQTTAADLHPLIVPRVGDYLKRRDHFDDDAWRDWQTHWYTTGLQGIEAQLADDPATGAFCHGNTLSMADICVTAIMVIKRAFNIEVPDIPIIDGIVARCETLEAFTEADPWRQPGAPARGNDY